MATNGSGSLKTELQDLPKIDPARCSGCGRCVAACPEKLFTLETVRFRKNSVMLHPERCADCGRCVIACPVAALQR